MTVHPHLGGGNFNEVSYQRALIKELIEDEIKAVSEKEEPVFYKGEIIGKKRLDLLVEEKLLIEIKAVPQF